VTKKKLGSRRESGKFDSIFQCTRKWFQDEIQLTIS